MDTGTVIAIIVAAFDILALIIGGIWMVGRIQSASETATVQISTTILHLSESVNSLTETLDRVEARQHNHETRISVMESKNGVCQPQQPQQPRYRKPPNSSQG